MSEDAVVAWVCEHVDVPGDTVRVLLEVEHEYLVGVGIVRDSDCEFRHYRPEDLAALPGYRDDARLNHDAAAFAGVPVETAEEVFRVVADLRHGRGRR